MYRSRTHDVLDTSALDFLSSTESDYHLLSYDVLGSEAHTIMLHEIGLLPRDNLKKILKLLEEIKRHPASLSTDKFEDIHESIEGHLIAKLGYEIGGMLQTARSRNDQVVLDTHMMIRDRINKISKAIILLIDSLLSKSNDHIASVMPMYTHLQHAQIGTFSHFLLSYTDLLFRDLDRLNTTYTRINKSPLGACAIGGSSINIDRNRTAVLLGFEGIINNSIDATSARDAIVEFVASLSIIMLTLSRIAEDFIIWSTVEFGYVEIPDKYSSTSSLMPQKKNPDILELIRAKAASISGSLITIISIINSLPSGYSRDFQDIKPEVIRASSTILGTLEVMRGIVQDLSINKKRMQQAANNSYAISLDIAEQLVSVKGISFRTAHNIVGSLVKKAVSKDNLPMSKLKEEDVQEVLATINPNLKAQELLRIIQELTPDKSLKLRSSLGSPNIQQQRQNITIQAERLKEYQESVSKRARDVNSAFHNLSQIVENYINS